MHIITTTNVKASKLCASIKDH